MGWLKKAFSAVTKPIEKAVSSVVETVRDVGSFIDDKVIQPIINDPVDAIVTTAAVIYGGPLVASTLGTSAATGAAIAAGTAKTGLALDEGKELDQALREGATTAAIVGTAQGLLGGTTPAPEVAPAPGVEVFPVPTAPVTVTPIESAGGLLSGATGAVVPSAFETAVNTALGQAPELGSFGQVGTAGFGTALPSAADVAAGLTAGGFAPGTAANLAGQTAAGVGATNLLGGATALAPVAAPAPAISIQQALRGAQMINQLLTPAQQAAPNLLGSAAEATSQMQGAVDYSNLLGLLSRRPGATGLLGTQFRPQSINLASLLG